MASMQRQACRAVCVTLSGQSFGLSVLTYICTREIKWPNKQSFNDYRLKLQRDVKLTHRWSLSSLLTSCIASYSFCSSVMPSMGLGLGSSHLPVIGFTLDTPQPPQTARRSDKKNAILSTPVTDGHVSTTADSTTSSSSSSSYFCSNYIPASDMNEMKKNMKMRGF